MDEEDWQDYEAPTPVDVEDRASASLQSPDYQRPAPAPASPIGVPVGKVLDAVTPEAYPANYAPRNEFAGEFARDRAREDAQQTREAASAQRDIANSDPYQDANGAWKVKRPDDAGNVLEYNAGDVARTDRTTGEKWLPHSSGARVTVGVDEPLAQRRQLLEQRKALTIEQQVEAAGVAELRAQIAPVKEGLKQYGNGPDELATRIKVLRAGIDPAKPNPAAEAQAVAMEKRLTEWHRAHPDYVTQRGQLDALEADIEAREARKLERRKRILSTMADPETMRRLAVAPRNLESVPQAVPRPDARGDVALEAVQGWAEKQAKAWQSPQGARTTPTLVTLGVLRGLAKQGAQTVGGQPIAQAIETLTPKRPPAQSELIASKEFQALPVAERVEALRKQVEAEARFRKQVEPGFDETAFRGKVVDRPGAWGFLKELGAGMGDALINRFPSDLASIWRNGDITTLKGNSWADSLISGRAANSEKETPSLQYLAGSQFAKGAKEGPASVATSMAVGIPSFLAGAKAGAIIGGASGAPAAGVGAVPGAAAGAAIGGLAGSVAGTGAAFYRLGQDTFIGQLRDKFAADFPNATDAEWNAFRTSPEVVAAGRKYGMIEGGVEGVSSALTAGIFHGGGKLARVLAPGLIDKIAAKSAATAARRGGMIMAKVAAEQGQEVGTETVQSKWQSDIEAQFALRAQGQTYGEAFKDVLAPTLVGGGLQAGVNLGVAKLRGGGVKPLMNADERKSGGEPGAGALETAGPVMPSPDSFGLVAGKLADVQAKRRTALEAGDVAGASVLEDDATDLLMELQGESLSTIGKVPPDIRRSFAQVGDAEVDFEGNEAALNDDPVLHFAAAAIGAQMANPNTSITSSKVDPGTSAFITAQHAGLAALRDVTGLLQGKALAPERAALLESLGLVQTEQDAVTGAASLRVTDDAVALLPVGVRERIKVAGTALPIAVTPGETGDLLANLVKTGVALRSGGLKPQMNADERGLQNQKKPADRVGGAPVLSPGANVRGNTNRTAAAAAAEPDDDQLPGVGGNAQPGGVPERGSDVAGQIAAARGAFAAESAGKVPDVTGARVEFNEEGRVKRFIDRTFPDTEHGEAVRDEELFHEADLLALRRQWKASGQKWRGASVTFEDFGKRHAESVLDDLAQRVEQMPDGQDRTTVERGIVAAFNLYFERYDMKPPRIQDWRAALGILKTPAKSPQGYPMDSFVFAHELARMLSQEHRRGAISEGALVKTLREIWEWIKAALVEVRNMAEFAYTQGSALAETRLMRMVYEADREFAILAKAKATDENRNPSGKTPPTRGEQPETAAKTESGKQKAEKPEAKSPAPAVSPDTGRVGDEVGGGVPSAPAAPVAEKKFKVSPVKAGANDTPIAEVRKELASRGIPLDAEVPEGIARALVMQPDYVVKGWAGENLAETLKQGVTPSLDPKVEATSKQSVTASPIPEKETDAERRKRIRAQVRRELAEPAEDGLSDEARAQREEADARMEEAGFVPMVEAVISRGGLPELDSTVGRLYGEELSRVQLAVRQHNARQRSSSTHILMRRLFRGSAKSSDELAGELLGGEATPNDLFAALEQELATGVKQWVNPDRFQATGMQSDEQVLYGRTPLDAEHTRLLKTALELGPELFGGVTAKVPELQADNARVTGPGLVQLYARTAYHGTPHTIADRFSTEKIGTGEGAQVYGWGLYFAENERVAEDYQRALSARDGNLVARVKERTGFSLPDGAIRTALEFTARDGETEAAARRAQYAASELRQLGLPEVLGVAKAAREALGGNKYTVTLDVEPEDLLDWDKPLSEQSEKVREALSRIQSPNEQLRNRFLKAGTVVTIETKNGGEITGTLTKNFEPSESAEIDGQKIDGLRIKNVTPWGDVSGQITGAQMYHNLTGEKRIRPGQPRPDGQTFLDVNRAAPKAASAQLQALGIPGIRFLDQGSRTPSMKVWQSGPSQWYSEDGKGGNRQFSTERAALAFAESLSTYNYVIFDDTKIRITAANGVPVESAEAAMRAEPSNAALYARRDEATGHLWDIVQAEPIAEQPVATGETAKWSKVAKTLYALQAEGKTLNAGQSAMLERAEKMLGQAVMFGDESKGTKGMESFKATWENRKLAGTTDFGGDFFDEKKDIGRFSPGDDQGALFARAEGGLGDFEASDAAGETLASERARILLPAEGVQRTLVDRLLDSVGSLSKRLLNVETLVAQPGFKARVTRFFSAPDAEVVVLVKPLGLEMGMRKRIESFLKDNGGVVADQWDGIVDTARMEEHYAEHRGKAFFPTIVNYYAGKRMVAMRLRVRSEKIGELRRMIGPSSIEPGTLRGEIVGPWAEVVRQATGGLDNGIHLSDSKEAGARESALWFSAAAKTLRAKPGPTLREIVPTLPEPQRRRLEALIRAIAPKSRESGSNTSTSGQAGPGLGGAAGGIGGSQSATSFQSGKGIPNNTGGEAGGQSLFSRREAGQQAAFDFADTVGLELFERAARVPLAPAGQTADLFGESTPFNLTAETVGGNVSPRPSTSKTQPGNTNDIPDLFNLESDRGRAGTRDAGGAGGVSTGSGATGGTGQSVDAGGSGRGDTQLGGPLSSDVPSTPVGEGGDRPVREQSPGTAERPAGDAGPVGGRGADDGGVSPDRGSPADAGIALVIPAASTSAVAESGGAARQDAQSGVASGYHPSLTPEQVGDVVFIEKRLANKAGVLITNGTGTGKTFTGLGAVDRMLKRGAKHILVVAPSDKIGSDWVATAKQFFGISDIAQLESTKDNGAGNRIVVATYANLGQNAALVGRPWDAVVADEAHYLSQAKDGTSTDALAAFRALTWHKDGVFRRAEMLEPGATQALAKLREMELATKGGLNAAQKAARERMLATLKAAQERVKAELAAIPLEKRPKALLMSATPFAYHFSLDYAEGYLFDHGPENTSGGYNSGSARDRFFMENFGYRMRYNKLTVPENATATGILERRFAERLMREGAMSGRALQVPHDYSRDFVLTESAMGAKIDEIMRVIQDSDELRPLMKHMGVGDYLSRRFLLESLKAQEAVGRIRKHLALGRKVVVFHDYKKGGTGNPLRLTSRGATETSWSQEGGQREVDIDSLYAQLRATVPGFDDLVTALDRLRSPIDLFTSELREAGIFNGSVPKERRKAMVDEFNRSGGPMSVILVQRASGKEGISLHDRDAQHQRVFMDLGIPGRPTDAIQSEGRIYRHGVKSNAVMEYLITGTNFERWTFAQTIAQRASTAENLAMGERARALLQSFASGFNDAGLLEPGPQQGTGGKERDQAQEHGDPFDMAVALYFTNAKKTSRNKSAEGIDYFPTPEPLGFKMVEWANIAPGEKVLEPSAGHGAIARFFPDSTTRHAVEPSNELAGRLALNATDTVIHEQRFEDYNIVNKFNAVVMNPPFGTAGKTAMEHLIKAVGHLREGGRVVALIPQGSSMEKRFDAWMYGEEAKGIHLRAEIKLPGVTFERAGTGVVARIVVLDKVNEENTPRGLTQQSVRDLSDVEDIKELFERLREISVPERVKVAAVAEEETAEPETPAVAKPVVTNPEVEKFKKLLAAGYSIARGSWFAPDKTDLGPGKDRALAHLAAAEAAKPPTRSFLDTPVRAEAASMPGIDPMTRRPVSQWTRDTILPSVPKAGPVDTSHLNALEESLSRERVRLAEATTEKERATRKVLVDQKQREIDGERKFLGLPSVEQEAAMTDDELLSQLGIDSAPEVPAVPKPERASNYSPADFRHTKTGVPIFVAKTVARVEREVFVAERDRAKALGGSYSSFRGAGAIPGFHFKTAEARDAFIGGGSAKLYARRDTGTVPFDFEQATTTGGGDVSNDTRTQKEGQGRRQEVLTAPAGPSISRTTTVRGAAVTRGGRMSERDVEVSKRALADALVRARSLELVLACLGNN